VRGSSWSWSCGT